MKKRYLALLLVVALLVCAAVLTVGAEETTPAAPSKLASNLTIDPDDSTKATGYCPHCEQTLGKDAYEAQGSTTEWTELVPSGHYNITTDGHYFLGEDYSTIGDLRGSGGDYIIHMNGKTFTRSTGTSTVYGIIAHRSAAAGSNFYIVGNEGDTPGTFITDGNVVADTNNKTAYELHVTLYSGNLISNKTTAAANKAVVWLAKGTSSFTMYGGTISGGYATQGGAIYALAGAEVNIYGGIIKDCRASNRAGGIYVTGSGTTLTMTGGTIQNCYIDTTATTTAYGGNIYVESGATAEISGTAKLLDGNVPSEDGVSARELVWGGNICGRLGDITITGNNVEISGGKANNGGNVYCENGELTIEGGTISGGQAATSGGNVYVREQNATADSSFLISGGIVKNGKADSTGPNIYMDGYSASSKLPASMTGGTICVDEADLVYDTDYAGGIHITNYTDFSFTGGEIKDITTTGLGGAIYLYDASTGVVNIGGDAKITNCTAKMGGAIYMDETTADQAVTMTGGTISGCSAEIEKAQDTDKDGNLLWQYTDGGETVKVVAVVVDTETTYYKYDSEGDTYTDVEVDPEEVTLVPYTVDVNTDKTGFGGAVYMVSGIFEITTGTDSEENPTTGKIESCSGNYGGSVYVAGGELKVNGGTITKGSAKHGANVFASGTVTITDGEISDGKTTTGYGGNLYMAKNSSFAMSNGTISGGKSARGGNVYAVNTTSCEMTGGKITDGTTNSDAYGRNIHINKATFKLNGGEIANGGKRSVYLENFDASIVELGNVTFTEKYANDYDWHERIQIQGSPYVGTSVASGQVKITNFNGNVTFDYTADSTASEYDFEAGNETYPILANISVDESYAGTGTYWVQDNSDTRIPVFVNMDKLGLVIGQFLGVTEDGVEEAVAALGDGEYAYYKVFSSNTANTPYTLTAPAVVDLNNMEVHINTAGYKLSAVDYRTDNGAKLDAKLYVDEPANLVLYTQNPVTKYRYLVVGHDAEGNVITDSTVPTYYSANRIGIEFTQVSVRPSIAGIYYTTRVVGNANVAPFIGSYGVALSTVAVPTENFLDEATVLYTEILADESATSYNLVTRSCLLGNILKDTLSAEENNNRGKNENVFANGYVLLDMTADQLAAGYPETLMADESCVYNMQSIMQAVNAMDSLNSTKKVVDFYNTWRTLNGENVMAGWQLDKIEEAWQAQYGASAEA